MVRPRYVRCVYDLECPTLDTRTGTVLEDDASSARENATLIDAYANDVREALALGGECYMARALACARMDRGALAALFPRLDPERQCPACTISGQGANLAAWGEGIDPVVAAELVACRATARAVEAAGAKCYRGLPDLQRKAARAAMAGAKRRPAKAGAT